MNVQSFRHLSEKWSLGKMVREKIPGKMVPWKNGPWKNVLQKLFSVKKMLGNLNDFLIFIDWFHYTHKKMFDVHLTILHVTNRRTLKESRKVCSRVLDFHRLITSQYSTYTPRFSTLTPRFFRGPFLRGLFFLGPFFRGLFFKGPFFRGFLFYGTIFRGQFFRDSITQDLVVVKEFNWFCFVGNFVFYYF